MNHQPNNISNTIRARYTHGPGIDEPLIMERDTDLGGTLNQRVYYHADGLGSIKALTDGTGAIVQTYTYDSFGNIAEQTGTVDNPYTYTGREFDPESGLYYYRARYYDARGGRFLSEDPSHSPQCKNSNIPYLLPYLLQSPQELNPYVYVLNNPIKFTDPMGLQKECGPCEKKVFSGDKLIACLAQRSVQILKFGAACAIAIKAPAPPFVKIPAIIGACGTSAALIIDCAYKAYECKKIK